MTRNLLIVDDDPADSAIVLSQLSSLDVEAIVARSGRQALQRLREHPISLILMDVEMPGWNGFETAEKIRLEKPWQAIPLIFLTGIAASDHHVFRGFDSGAVDYVLKSVDPRILISKVSVFLDLLDKIDVVQAARIREVERELELERFAALQEQANEVAMANSQLSALLRVLSKDLMAPMSTLERAARAPVTTASSDPAICWRIIC